MKSNIMKILVITAIMIFVGAGESSADDDRGHHRGHAYGHYKHKDGICARWRGEWKMEYRDVPCKVKVEAKRNGPHHNAKG